MSRQTSDKEHRVVSDAHVTCSFGALVLLPGHPPFPISATIHYAATDPYAVRLSFDTGAEQPVEWVFARDLLITGLHQPSGLGDVQIWPVPQPPRRIPARKNAIYLKIIAADEEAVVSAPARTLHDFLQRTRAIVPVGTEGTLVDVGEFVTRMLEDAAGPEGGAIR